MVELYEDISNLRVVGSQITPVMAKNLILISIGMLIGYPAILIPALLVDKEFDINEEQISWIASLSFITVLVGGSLSGILTQIIGRKRFMQILCIPMVMCWLVFKFASKTWHILCSLSLYGLCQGLFEAAVLSYVAEISQPKLRGMLTSLTSTSVSFGILIQYSLGTFISWRNIGVVSSVVPTLAIISLFFVPESPYWLVMQNKHYEAQKNLAWLRGWTTVKAVQEEFDEMCKDYNSTRSTPAKSNFQNLKKYYNQNFYWPFSLVVLISFFGVFTGAWTLQSYAVVIFSTFKVPIDRYLATFVLGILQFIGSIINVILIRYLGKRTSTFISMGGIVIVACGIGTHSYVNNINHLVFDADNTNDTKVSEYNWVPLVLLLSLTFLSQCGIRTLNFNLMAEIFTHETRATGCGILSGIFNAFGFLANKTFLIMVTTMTLPGVYWFNCVVALVGLILLHFMLPETEGKSLQDIINHFSRVSKLSNKVQR